MEKSQRVINLINHFDKIQSEIDVHFELLLMNLCTVRSLREHDGELPIGISPIEQEAKEELLWRINIEKETCSRAFDFVEEELAGILAFRNSVTTLTMLENFLKDFQHKMLINNRAQWEDKLCNLVGLLTIGEIPTGSCDVDVSVLVDGNGNSEGHERDRT